MVDENKSGEMTSGR